MTKIKFKTLLISAVAVFIVMGFSIDTKATEPNNQGIVQENNQVVNKVDNEQSTNNSKSTLEDTNSNNDLDNIKDLVKLNFPKATKEDKTPETQLIIELDFKNNDKEAMAVADEALIKKAISYAKEQAESKDREDNKLDVIFNIPTEKKRVILKLSSDIIDELSKKEIANFALKNRNITIYINHDNIKTLKKTEEDEYKLVFERKGKKLFNSKLLDANNNTIKKNIGFRFDIKEKGLNRLSSGYIVRKKARDEMVVSLYNSDKKTLSIFLPEFNMFKIK